MVKILLTNPYCWIKPRTKKVFIILVVLSCLFSCNEDSKNSKVIKVNYLSSSNNKFDRNCIDTFFVEKNYIYYNCFLDSNWNVIDLKTHTDKFAFEKKKLYYENNIINTSNKEYDIKLNNKGYMSELSFTDLNTKDMYVFHSVPIYGIFKIESKYLVLAYEQSIIGIYEIVPNELFKKSKEMNNYQVARQSIDKIIYRLEEKLITFYQQEDEIMLFTQDDKAKISKVYQITKDKIQCIDTLNYYNFNPSHFFSISQVLPKRSINSFCNGFVIGKNDSILIFLNE